MSIHKEGYRIILFSFITFSILAGLVFIFLVPFFILSIVLYVTLSIIFIGIISFFRYPRRHAEADNNTILSVADGKVVAIEEVTDSFFNDKRLQISVFMSPLNIHANWYPVNGIVKYTNYQPGRHLVAFHPKSSMDNEMAITVVETIKGQQILIKQIAGIMARRIVNYAKVNEEVEQGEELGFIKFGSRIDLILPLNISINIELNQQVKGKKTVIGFFKD